MAKTWTVNEAYNAIKANDKAGIADFGKRFPLATAALARAGENSGLDILMGAMPDRVTMRILEMSLKDGVEVTEDGDAEEAMNAPVEKKVAKKSEKPAPAKKEKAAKPKKSEKPVEDDAEDDEAEDDAQDYSKMSAVELFKLCKSRKIKVEPKQKSSVYIKALEAEDAKAKAVEGDSDDDWSEDEEEEKPAKKSAPAKGKAKKSAPAEDDDSDDWDI